MKKVLLKSKVVITYIVISFLITISVSAQSPGLMSYQAVIRDSGSEEATCASLKSTDCIVASAVVGDFSAIDWPERPYFIKVETDITGGADYLLMGIRQFKLKDIYGTYKACSS
ncbi:MAG: hypothetical protein GXO47_07790 [Chlorobi bacterium]|nr:hypothetical protein [Chlorobiota bacterium]